MILRKAWLKSEKESALGISEAGVVGDPGIQVVSLCVGYVFDHDVITHVLEDMLVRIAIHNLQTVDATMVLLNKVLEI
jgi:hypothetical protein